MLNDPITTRDRGSYVEVFRGRRYLGHYVVDGERYPSPMLEMTDDVRDALRAYLPLPEMT